MTKDEFILRFRGRHLLFLTEAWSSRRETPSELGMLMDQHALELKRLLSEMYDALVPQEAPSPPAPTSKPPVPNGTHTPRR